MSQGIPSTSKDNTNLLKKLVALCTLTTGALSAVPALAQSTLPPVGSFAPVIAPLKNDDPTSNVDPLSLPIYDTVTPTTTAPTPLATPGATALESSMAPLTIAPTPSVVLPTLAPTTSAVPQTFAPTPSVAPTTPTPTPTTVFTTTESPPVATPITPTPQTVINSNISSPRTLTVPNSSGFISPANQ